MAFYGNVFTAQISLEALYHCKSGVPGFRVVVMPLFLTFHSTEVTLKLFNFVTSSESL